MWDASLDRRANEVLWEDRGGGAELIGWLIGAVGVQRWLVGLAAQQQQLHYIYILILYNKDSSSRTNYILILY